MALTKYKLGELIELVVETNSFGEYGPDDVRGMTITKEVIPTKADVSNSDLSKFIVVHPNEFVYNPRTHGKKIGFGFNNTSECFIISWNNIAFRVKQDAINKVLPTYLFLHFNREEWDREACYRSWGSSTEVFTWDAMCEMEILLPSLAQQQKFVDIYKSLQMNLNAYLSNVDDLKLVCEGYIDNLKKCFHKQKIGEYIIESDERNSELTYSEDDVVGVSIKKDFIATKANMDGVSVDNYKVIRKGMFVFNVNTARMGDKFAIALCDNGEHIVSSIYGVFRSKDESKLLPEYLFMYFIRPEFDRYVRFNSWGSARETFTMDDMREVAIPIPDIKVQQEIVNIHRCYIERQRIAAQLKKQFSNICPILIRGSILTEK